MLTRGSLPLIRMDIQYLSLHMMLSERLRRKQLCLSRSFIGLIRHWLTGRSDTSPPIRLEIRPEVIQEEDAEADKARESVANTLKNLQSLPKKTGTVRGRREVRQTIFVPAPMSIENGSPENAAHPKSIRAMLADDHHASDTQSIRSARSLTSLTSNPVKHPELGEPGLNSSVVETVSAWFSEGLVSKMVIVGEMALAYNSPETSTAPPHAIVRLDNFSSLEKVAPNPTFIEPLADRVGEYSVNLSSLSRPSVAFKYQVHLEEASLASQTPILVQSSWKIEPTQASVIVHYKLNPALVTEVKKELKFHNLILVVGIEGAKASACLSKPVGTFSRERSIIYWKLGDVSLGADQPVKLLARFTTDVEAKSGATEARWELTGEDTANLGSGLDISQEVTSISGSGEADPFADEDAVVPPSASWKPAASVRKIISGTYTAS
jgi:hypothetical protein